MPVLETHWRVKQLAEALTIAPTSATRKATTIRRRLQMLLAALEALEPDLRPCDRVSQVLAALRDGGRLAQMDEQGLRDWMMSLTRNDDCGE